MRNNSRLLEEPLTRQKNILNSPVKQKPISKELISNITDHAPPSLILTLTKIFCLMLEPREQKNLKPLNYSPGKSEARPFKLSGVESGFSWWACYKPEPFQITCYCKDAFNTVTVRWNSRTRLPVAIWGKGCGHSMQDGAGVTGALSSQRWLPIRFKCPPLLTLENSHL